MTAAIYTVSDLSRRRTDLLGEARKGLARIRDLDGTSLVMLPELRYEVDKVVADFASQVLSLARLVRGTPAAERTVYDFGELAWLHRFDDEDLVTFAEEATEAILLSLRRQTLEPLEELEIAWRATAEAIEDNVRREVLLGSVADEDFTEVSRPEAEAEALAEA